MTTPPGAKPSLSQISGFFGQSPAQIGAKQSTEGRGRINLKAVGEVLAGYDLDPAHEIAKILAKTKPVFKDGKPVLDEETGLQKEEPVLPTDLALKVHLELLRYTRPQLKAVEVTMKEPELTDEQVEARIKALAARRQSSTE